MTPQRDAAVARLERARSELRRFQTTMIDTPSDNQMLRQLEQVVSRAYAELAAVERKGGRASS